MKTLFRFFKRWAAVAVLGGSVVFLAGCGRSNKLKFDKPFFVDEQNQAIRGYDAVSYFEEEPTKGTTDHSIEWMGVTWLFASEEHKEKFEKDPEKYAPQYGGYCAWGLGAKDELFPIDPTAYKVVDGKLYLNFNQPIQQKWKEDMAALVKEADKLWPKHKAKLLEN